MEQLAISNGNKQNQNHHNQNLSKLTLQPTYFPLPHFFQNLSGFLHVRTNWVLGRIDFEILLNIFPKNCNIMLISENAMNCSLAVSLKLLNASFLL